MNADKPGGECVHDRPKTVRKNGSNPGREREQAVLRNHEARSGPRSLAFRAATAQGRPSAAGIWEMSVNFLRWVKAI